MAGGGDKSEKPTAHKLRKAREKGQIARSKDITMAVGLLASFVTLATFFPFYRTLVAESFAAVREMAVRLNDPSAIGQFFQLHAWLLLRFIATLIPIPLACILACLVPGGWIFTLSKIKPDLQKINPLSGVKRMFSASHYTEVGKMLVKCILVLILLWLVVNQNIGDLLQLQRRYLQQAIGEGLALYQQIVRYFLGVVILFALLDLPLSKFMHHKQLRMSKQEVKEEHKNIDGNPQIKGRIRQLQRQMAMGQINRVVPEADVVITNPTHYAVALKYDPQKADAPYILAKGMDETALYIREVAQRHKVEVVEFPPLARAVYHTTRVNQQIPAQLFRAIAHLLSYVLQLKKWRAGQATQPPRLDTQIVIPKEVLKSDVQQ